MSLTWPGEGRIRPKQGVCVFPEAPSAAVAWFSLLVFELLFFPYTDQSRA